MCMIVVINLNMRAFTWDCGVQEISAILSDRATIIYPLKCVMNVYLTSWPVQFLRH